MMEPTFYPRAQAALDRGSHSRFDLVGFMPLGVDPSSPIAAVPQLHAGYGHGGGWHDFEGFEFKDGDEPQLLYPGDPPTEAVAFWNLREERIILFDHAWVAVVQPDGSFRVSRMD
jgi:hypothetical protein